jgi:hypothetical protein
VLPQLQQPRILMDPVRETKCIVLHMTYNMN